MLILSKEFDLDLERINDKSVQNNENDFLVKRKL
jgi:hypothetical protein